MMNKKQNGHVCRPYDKEKIKISDLPLMSRTKKYLGLNGISTVGELTDYVSGHKEGWFSLLHIHNIGKKCLDELVRVLHDEKIIDDGSLNEIKTADGLYGLKPGGVHFYTEERVEMAREIAGGADTGETIARWTEIHEKKVHDTQLKSTAAALKAIRKYRDLRDTKGRQTLWKRKR